MNWIFRTNEKHIIVHMSLPANLIDKAHLTRLANNGTKYMTISLAKLVKYHPDPMSLSQEELGVLFDKIIREDKDAVEIVPAPTNPCVVPISSESKEIAEKMVREHDQKKLLKKKHLKKMQRDIDIYCANTIRALHALADAYISHMYEKKEYVNTRVQMDILAIQSDYVNRFNVLRNCVLQDRNGFDGEEATIGPSDVCASYFKEVVEPNTPLLPVMRKVSMILVRILYRSGSFQRTLVINNKYSRVEREQLGDEALVLFDLISEKPELHAEDWKPPGYMVVTDKDVLDFEKVFNNLHSKEKGSAKPAKAENKEDAAIKKAAMAANKATKVAKKAVEAVEKAMEAKVKKNKKKKGKKKRR